MLQIVIVSMLALIALSVKLKLPEWVNAAIVAAFVVGIPAMAGIRALIARWRPSSWPVIRYELRLGIRVAAGGAVIVFALLTTCFALIDLATRGSVIWDLQKRSPAAVCALVAVVAYLVACSIPPRRRLVLIRKFGSDAVKGFIRDGIVPYLAGIGRLVTLSDRLFDGTEVNPQWSVGTAQGVGVFLVFLGPIVSVWVLWSWSILSLPLGLAVGAGMAVALLRFGPRLLAVGFPTVAWVLRTRIHVSSPRRVVSARRIAAWTVWTPLRFSPFAPMLAVDCDDAFWRPTVEELIRSADVVLVVYDRKTEHLDWELELVHAIGKPVVEVCVPAGAEGVRKRLAEALDTARIGKRPG